MDDVVDGDEADCDIRITMMNCNSSNSFINTTSLIISSINITIRMIVNQWQNVSGEAEKQQKQETSPKRKAGKVEKQEKQNSKKSSGQT